MPSTPLVLLQSIAAPAARSISQSTAAPPVHRQLFTLLHPYRWWVLLSALTTVGIAAIETSIGFLIQYVIDSGIHGERESFIRWVILLLVLIGAGVVDKYILKRSTVHFAVLTVKELRSRVAQHLQRQPLPALSQVSSGDLLSRLTNDAGLIQSYFLFHFSAVVYIPAVFLCSVGYMFWIHWQLTAIAFAVIPAALYASHRISRRMGRLTGEIQAGQGALEHQAQSILQGLSVVKSYALGDVLDRKFYAQSQAVLQGQLGIERRRALLSVLSALLNAAPLCLAVLGGAYFISRGQMQPSDLISYLSLINFAVLPLAYLPNLFGTYREMKGAAERLFAMLEWPVEAAAAERPTAANLAEPAVRLHDVSFAYPGQEEMILQELHLEVPAGRTVALVGPSGSGKSTLLRLLCGELPAEGVQGRVELFGLPLGVPLAPTLRRLVSAVSQDSYLYPVSIADNIGAGRAGASREEIEAAAAAAHALEFIRQLPEGFDTVLEERGANLSGGQRQRLCIARALLKGAPLLLLDEATSALDSRSEERIQQAIAAAASGGQTLLIAAHRLHTIRGADEIIVMEGGRITARGRHEELLQQGGLYWRLYEQQAQEAAAGEENRG